MLRVVPYVLWGRFSAATVIVALWVGGSSNVWSRIQVSPAAIDLKPLAARAAVIFRGTVESVSDLLEPFNRPAVARFSVDRWYRGQAASAAAVRFDRMHFSGHNCISFPLGSRWLVVAVQKSGYLELVDDCYGALEVSRSLATASSGVDLVSQLEMDFIAGLEDPDSKGRLVSIQRLGNLKSPSSRPALHRVIELGNPTEVKWAIYAALRTGDTSILGRVREFFQRQDSGELPFLMAWELGQLRDRTATRELIEIADTSSYSEARKSALSALGNMRVVEALPAIAAHLADPDSGVRFYAVNAMEAVTHEPACTLSPGHTEGAVEPQINQCAAWWEREGKRTVPHKD